MLATESRVAIIIATDASSNLNSLALLIVVCAY